MRRLNELTINSTNVEKNNVRPIVTYCHRYFIALSPTIHSRKARSNRLKYGPPPSYHPLQAWHPYMQQLFYGIPDVAPAY